NLFRREDADISYLHFRGTDLANFIHHVAHHVPPHAGEVKKAVDDSLEIPPRSVRDRFAIFPFEALQILPYLVCCHCGSQTLKSLGKAVQPHLQMLRSSFITMVPTEGVEPTRPRGHQILSLARLPIPPRRQCCSLTTYGINQNRRLTLRQ